MPDLAVMLHDKFAVQSFFEDRCAPAPAATGVNRNFYLDLAEHIVLSALPWQREDGRIIDPTVGKEPATATARFVGALGGLIGAGRCQDLIEVCAKSMDHCCQALATGMCDGQPTESPDFYTKELVYAYRALRGRVPAERHRQWARWLAEFDPWQTYWSARERATHNWPIYVITGEFLKQVEGLVDARAFIQDLLCDQKPNFTELGMYRDPNDPITYDLTVRQQLGLMLFYGYDGKHRAWIDEVLRKGGVMTLLFQSVTGQAPFGGRSNQFHIQEGMIACICETEARRYVGAGQSAIAGAFKRAARRAAISTRRWILEMMPFRATKNGFDPALRHGTDSGEYSSYGLLAASLFATAWHLADESIQEYLTPAEFGGFAFHLWPAFHKIFATCGGYHLEIDTKAQLEKDATGLGRLHKLGAPPELALSMPISGRPTYSLCTQYPQYHLTIGPGWRDRAGHEWRLAQFSSEIEEVRLEVIQETTERVEFRVIYQGDLGGVRRIVEHYALESGGIYYRVELSPTPPRYWLSVPLLESDGRTPAPLKSSDKSLGVSYLDYDYLVTPGEGIASVMPGPSLANRNGIYRDEVLENCLGARFRICPRAKALRPRSGSIGRDQPGGRKSNR